MLKKQFDKELETLRQLIESKARPFEDDKKAQKERVERAAKDMDYFGRTYFPHYITSSSSALHKYICERYPAMIMKSIDTGEGDREADAAPRGNAKSTWTTLVLLLWCAAYKYRTFPLIVSETSSQAEDFISFIKAELETNERLKQDFPELCGEGPIWRSDVVITRSGTKITRYETRKPQAGLGNMRRSGKRRGGRIPVIRQIITIP
ncbi:hypothetical protein [Candidatus Magnetominusculus dajiuhuensis]|uniref:hypothetical protein n=1 Tax=Candidatus Magnetominusculus dajiuhuensis TaxID=3137712 RepID=UPI003B42F786